MSEKDCFCQYFLKLTFAETKWKFWIVYTKSYLWNIREPFVPNLGVKVKDNLQRFLLYFVVAIYYVTLSGIIHKYCSRRQPFLFFCFVLFTAAQPYCWLCSNYDIFWHDFGIFHDNECQIGYFTVGEYQIWTPLSQNIFHYCRDIFLI